jgi:NAD(P)-dependent dehydrogenase (short-subunit alcohol dehydrogenase family)
MTVAADVADHAGLAAAVALARGRFGRIDGVFHAAGVPGAGLVQGKTRDMAERVFAPKLRGTLLLAEVLAPCAPELFVVFSSSVAFTGGLGEVDYCAANNFLGAFAVQRSAAGLRTLAVEWGPWRWDSWQRELTASVPWLARWFEELRRRHGITAREGAEALARAAASDLPRVAVLPQGFEETVRTFTTELRQRLEEGISHPGRHERPALMNAYVAPGTEMERRVAACWGEVLGIDRVGIHDHFFALGGNSLAGMEVVARLGRLLRRDLPAAILFEGPTVASLARLLAADGEDLTAVVSGGGRGRKRREVESARRGGG